MKDFQFRVSVACSGAVRALEEEAARRAVSEVIALLTAQWGLADVRTQFNGSVVDIDFSIGRVTLVSGKRRS
jgi:hypothetical protein